MSNIRDKRLVKEVKQMIMSPPPGITLLSPTRDEVESGSSVGIEKMVLGLTMEGNSLYEGTYALELTYPRAYPIDAPKVVFLPHVQAGVPIHPHIYGNGHICLDVLYAAAWSPVQSSASVGLAIQSMLAGNSIAERPPDNDSYVESCRAKKGGHDPRNTRFVFHDDKV
ncbi:putative ubiquitin-conjugating enzyme E2 17 [Savitreella phatthalungensis]